MSNPAPPTSEAPVRTVELFAGIGGFRIAADALGFETVWSNDADSDACTVYRDRLGPIHFGDVRDVWNEVPPHDLLTAGFPCQPFSSAGKKRGIRDPRGTLFEVIVDVLAAHRPRAFVLENVKRLLTMERGSHFATILLALVELGYSVEWRLLNAAHFGLPQNRWRVFVIGVRDDDSSIPRLARHDDVRADAAWIPIGEHGRRFPVWGAARGGRFHGSAPSGFAEATEPVTLSAVLESDVAEAFDFTESTRDRITNSDRVERFVDGVEVLSNQGGGARMGYTVYGIGGLAPTLTATTSRHYERYRIGDRYRRLTPVEYARIQGFPDRHCDGVAQRLRYRLIGNSVPPPMASWVMRQLPIGR